MYSNSSTFLLSPPFMSTKINEEIGNKRSMSTGYDTKSFLHFVLRPTIYISLDISVFSRLDIIKRAIFSHITAFFICVSLKNWVISMKWLKLIWRRNISDFNCSSFCRISSRSLILNLILILVNCTLLSTVRRKQTRNVPKLICFVTTNLLGQGL